MAIVLKKLIPEVRSALSDVPSEFITDTQITNELEKAEAYCNAVVCSGTTESYLSTCIVVVATYYAYVNYTTLSERQLGTLPPTAPVRLKALQTIAASFLQLVSKYPLNNDLTVDTKTRQGRTTAATIVFTPSVVEEE